MKIVFYVPSFGAGGAQKQAALLFNELHARAPGSVMLIYVRDGPNLKWLEPANPYVIRLQYSKLFDPRLFLQLHRLASCFGATHLVSWLHSGDTAAGILSCFIRPAYKWVLMERDSFYPAGLRFLVRIILGRFADRIVCNSEAGILYWSKNGVLPSRLGRTYNIIAAPEQGFDSIDSCLSRDEPVYKVVSWGRMEWQKDPVRVARVFRQLVISGEVQRAESSERSLRCMIGGDGTLRSELDSLKVNLAHGSLEIRGYIPQTGVFLRPGVIFVSLSKHEGAPNAVLEALRAGCLLVLSAIPEHLEIVGPDYPFLVAPEATDSAIVELLRRALSVSEGVYSEYLSAARVYLARTTSSGVRDLFVKQLQFVS